MEQSSRISGWTRSVLFRRLPRRTNIKTVFWYCEEPEAVLSWRSKCFQRGPDREPLKVRIPDLPDVFVVSIESDNTGRLDAVGRLDTAILMRSSFSCKKIAREVQSALIRAAAVHAQVLLDNDDDIDTKIGERGTSCSPKAETHPESRCAS